MPQYAYARKIKNKNHSTVMWKKNQGKFFQHLLTHVWQQHTPTKQKERRGSKSCMEKIYTGEGIIVSALKAMIFPLSLEN
jgi:glycerol kinase